MNITLSKSALLAALTPLVPVCEAKTAQNILSHVHVAVFSGQVALTATDYDITIRSLATATSDELGAFTVPARTLFDVLKTLPDRDVTLSVLENAWVEVRCGSSRFKVPGLPASDFPERQSVSWQGAATIPARLLADVLAKTVFSASHDETRPSLNGVMVKATPEAGELRLLAVSTDGHRLSKTEALGGDGGAVAWSAIVSNKAVSILGKLLAAGDVAISCDNRNVNVRAGDVEFTARCMDGTFPDYTKVIPSGARNRLQVAKSALVAAVRRVSLMTSVKTSIVKLEAENGALVLTANNPETGTARDELPVDLDGGFTVGVNHKYVLDVLGAIDGETVTVAALDQFSPLLLTSADDAGSLFVVMPMRV